MVESKERTYSYITEPVDGEMHPALDGSMHSYAAASALLELQKAYAQPLKDDPDVEGILKCLDSDIEEICNRLRAWANWVRSTT